MRALGDPDREREQREDADGQLEQRVHLGQLAAHGTAVADAVPSCLESRHRALREEAGVNHGD